MPCCNTMFSCIKAAAAENIIYGPEFQGLQGITRGIGWQWILHSGQCLSSQEASYVLIKSRLRHFGLQ